MMHGNEIKVSYLGFLNSKSPCIQETTKGFIDVIHQYLGIENQPHWVFEVNFNDNQNRIQQAADPCKAHAKAGRLRS